MAEPRSAFVRSGGPRRTFKVYDPLNPPVKPITPAANVFSAAGRPRRADAQYREGAKGDQAQPLGEYG